MIKLSNVLKRDHPMTRQEDWIIEAIFYSVLFAVGLIILVICILSAGDTQWVILVFTTINPISIWIIAIPLLILEHFMSGYIYIRRFNKALRYGTRFEGRIIQRLEAVRGMQRRYPEYQLVVRLNNGQVVDSPIYTSISPSYQECSVYLYKNKYYFTGFKYVPGNAISNMEFWFDKEKESKNLQ